MYRTTGNPTDNVYLNRSPLYIYIQIFTNSLKSLCKEVYSCRKDEPTELMTAIHFK